MPEFCLGAVLGSLPGFGLGGNADWKPSIVTISRKFFAQTSSSPLACLLTHLCESESDLTLSGRNLRVNETKVMLYNAHERSVWCYL